MPLKNIVATHPLELVHLDYLCLEPGKGLEESVLVITDHFTRYAQVYVTRTQTGTNNGKDPLGQVYCPLWSPWKDFNGSRMKFSEAVGGWPLWVDGDEEDMDQSISSTDQWSMWKVQPHSDQYAWDFTWRKRSQSGRTTLECWSMHIIALEIQPQGSAPTISCLADNLTFQLMWHLVWLHIPSWSQTQQSLSRN